MIFNSDPDFRPKLAEPLSETLPWTGSVACSLLTGGMSSLNIFEQASVGPSVPMNEGGGSLNLPIASIQLYWLEGLRTRGLEWDEYILGLGE